MSSSSRPSTPAPPLPLTPIDWILILIYLGGCMAAGLWMRRYVRGVQDFAVAGREMDVNLGIASLAATDAPGLWHVRATDILTGASDTAAIAVAP